MSGRIPQQFIDDLLARADIVDLIDARVPLKKSGRNFVARCPFHDEKTPSFSVSREKQFYHCFGCGANGTAIGFLMDFDHLGFVEAIEELAQTVGVEVPREQGGTTQPKTQNSALYTLQEQVRDLYHKQLLDRETGRVAVRYLRARGVDGAVARAYRLGYALPGWDNLGSQYPPSTLMEAGLRIRREDGRGGYDRFRNRLIFPIHDRRGRVVGFGGRVLDDSLPKYLNSPETDVFIKGNELYGLYELLGAHSKPERILVVEGYMDVVALAQAGIGYAVATLGTAASRNHLQVLFRSTTELVFCFDGDGAGRKAAWRAVEQALPELRDGRQIRIMHLPSSDDPDSYIRTHGREAFEQQIEQARRLSDYFFETLVAGLELDSMEGRSVLANRARPLIAKLPASTFREMMAARLNEMVTTEAVPGVTVSSRSHRRHESAERGPVSSVRTAIGILVQFPGIARSGIALPDALRASASEGEVLLVRVYDLLVENPLLGTAGLIERFRGSPHEKHLAKLARMEFLVPEAVEQEFAGAIERIDERLRKARLAELLRNKQKPGDLSEAERQMLGELASGRHNN